jgi:hypothetical protein
MGMYHKSPLQIEKGRAEGYVCRTLQRSRWDGEEDQIWKEELICIEKSGMERDSRKQR